MRVLTWLHRWWGVVFCLLFAMWFASGIVMHFVPFPARSADRFAALLPIDPVGAVHGPAQAIAKTGTPGVFRVALGDGSGTELYVASTTGDVALVTTQKARALNYFGSIAHWLYPTALRQHLTAWSALMWWLSLAATIGAALGLIAGVLHLVP